MDYFRELIEATLAQVARKQKSITRLFPDFFTNPEKLPGIIAKGGLRMTGMEKDTWKFNVHSGSEEGKWYEVVLRWKNIVPEIQRGIQDRRNWTKPKDGQRRVNLKKLAAYIFKKADIELDCECPADTYYGGDYIRTQPRYSAKYGDQENRPPDKRNPKQYGAHCKHIQALYKVLPWYKTTMAQWLKKEYNAVIQKAEKKASAELTGFQQAAKALGKRKTEAVATKVDIERELKKHYKSTLNKRLSSSTFPGEQTYLKFWILTDGTIIPVEYSHSDTIEDALEGLYVDYDDLRAIGAAAGSLLGNELNISGRKKFTTKQIAKLRNLGIEYQVDSLVRSIGSQHLVQDIKSSKELAYYLEYGKEKWESMSKDKIHESKHSHDKCMNCSSPPEVEVLWAEGMGHCWFCMKCFKKWATEGDGQGDVCAVKKVQDGKAASKWKDNDSPNIMDTLDFLKEAVVTELEPEEAWEAIQESQDAAGGWIHLDGKIEWFDYYTPWKHYRDAEKKLGLEDLSKSIETSEIAFLKYTALGHIRLILEKDDILNIGITAKPNSSQMLTIGKLVREHSVFYFDVEFRGESEEDLEQIDGKSWPEFIKAVRGYDR